MVRCLSRSLLAFSIYWIHSCNVLRPSSTDFFCGTVIWLPVTCMFFEGPSMVSLQCENKLGTCCNVFITISLTAFELRYLLLSSCSVDNVSRFFADPDPKHSALSLIQANPLAYVKSTIISLALPFNIFAKMIIASYSYSIYFWRKFGFRFRANAAPSTALPEKFQYSATFSTYSMVLSKKLSCSCPTILADTVFIASCLCFGK